MSQTDPNCLRQKHQKESTCPVFPVPSTQWRGCQLKLWDCCRLPGSDWLESENTETVHPDLPFIHGLPRLVTLLISMQMQKQELSLYLHSRNWRLLTSVKLGKLRLWLGLKTVYVHTFMCVWYKMQSWKESQHISAAEIPCEESWDAL